MTSVSDTEDKPDQHSSIHAPSLVIACPDGSSEEEEEMALDKGGKNLRELLAARGKNSAPKETNKPQVLANLPPPPPLPVTSTGLLPNPDLKRKRKDPEVHEVEEGEMIP